jgi:hypothetical protein
LEKKAEHILPGSDGGGKWRNKVRVLGENGPNNIYTCEKMN